MNKLEIWQNTNETNVPIDLLVWIVKDNVIKPSVLKTYLYLKLQHTDRILFTSDLYNDISIGLNVTIKTARSHIKELLRVKYIGHDTNTNILYVRSKYKIIPAAKKHSDYQVKISYAHFEHFTEFTVAATIAYMVKKGMQKAKYKPALTNDGAPRSLYIAKHKYLLGYPISLSYLSTFLGKSISWVDKYKKKAQQLGWIKVRHHWDQTNISWPNKSSYLSYHLLPMGRAKKQKGMMYLIGTDRLASNLYVHKRKKSV